MVESQKLGGRFLDSNPTLQLCFHFMFIKVFEDKNRLEK